MMNISRSTLLFTNLLKPTGLTKAFSTLSLHSRTYATAVESSESSSKNVVPSGPTIPANSRFVYPEFLPDPNMKLRNPLKEKLERQDMLSRREHIDIPEFYVGSIMAVTTSDKHSIGKTTRFVFLCIDRGLCGLRSFCVLRNAIDNQGIEVKFELYDPTVQKIEVLLLEKRLDDQLYYLRDAPLEYSTIDVNMEAKYHPEGAPVPVNPIQVTLRPRPWMQRWERKNLKGVSEDSINERITDKMRKQKIAHEKPWEKYDLMKEYRATIAEEEQLAIYSEIYPTLNKFRKETIDRNKLRLFVKPKKTN